MAQHASQIRRARRQRPRTLCLAGRPIDVAQARRRAAHRRHADRQSRRHHPARARDARRRRPDRLRGHAASPASCSTVTASRRRSRPITSTTRPRRGRSCCARLAEGAAVALVSDAGTPLISDPGYKLVRAASDGRPCGHRAARRFGACWRRLTVAGLPTDQFFFAGFLPPKQAARRNRIAELSRIPATLVLFETGPRVAAALADLAAGLGLAARPRCAANSPSCTRKSAAAILRRWRKHYARHRAARRDRHRGGAAAGAAADQRRRDRRTCCATALDRVSLKDAVGEVARRNRPAAPRGLSARAGARQGSGQDANKGQAMARRAEPATAAAGASRRRGPKESRPSGSAFRLRAAPRCCCIAKAYRIVARRWKTPFGEIDIIAAPPSHADFRRGQGARHS